MYKVWYTNKHTGLHELDGNYVYANKLMLFSILQKSFEAICNAESDIPTRQEYITLLQRIMEHAQNSNRN